MPSVANRGGVYSSNVINAFVTKNKIEFLENSVIVYFMTCIFVFHCRFL